jgi:hypothetical protein
MRTFIPLISYTVIIEIDTQKQIGGHVYMDTETKKQRNIDKYIKLLLLLYTLLILLMFFVIENISHLD